MIALVPKSSDSGWLLLLHLFPINLLRSNGTKSQFVIGDITHLHKPMVCCLFCLITMAFMRHDWRVVGGWRARRINAWPSQARAYACRFWWPTIDTKRKLSKHPPYTNPKPCESKIHSQTFFRGLRASGDEKKFGTKREILKRQLLYDANADIDMIKTIPFT